MRLPNGSITLQEVGILPTLTYFPFLGWKWVHVQVSCWACALPRRGHGASPGKKGSSPRRRKCSPKRRNVCLGEPEDGSCGVSSPPRRR